MAKKTQDLHEFLLDEMRDLYDAEKQLTKALPRMAKAANNDELRNAITEHLEVTKGHVQRLEQCFEHLSQKAKSKPCKGIKGILEEGQEMLQEDLEEAVMDVAIAAGGRKVEHYEMVAYESLHALAEQLDLEEVAELLNETLEEEREADQKLLEICQTALQEAGAGGQSEDMDEEEGASSGRGRGRSAGATARAGARTQTAGRGSNGGGRNSNGGKSRGSNGGKARGGGASAGGNGHTAQPLTDHDEIRRWAEERGATPSCVRGTGKKGGIGMIRLDFPGYTGEKSLQPIDWDQWFEQFDQNKLALLVQETTAGGEQSNFNKLVSRSTIKEGSRRQAAH